MLKELLESKKCFKLVCAAGNEDVTQVEKLVALYSKAGCRFFDLCADPEVIKSAKKGLINANLQSYICVSIGTKGDSHIRKAKINNNCIKCEKCLQECPQDAIIQEHLVNESKCIGCGKCSKVCDVGAIDFIDRSKDIKKILPPLIKLGIDCVELHAKMFEGYSENEIIEKCDYINKNFDGFLSICINSSESDREKLIEILKKLISKRKPYTTIIKAEGDSMTGSIRNLKTTMETIKVAELINKAKLPVYVMLSGGTNIESTRLAKKMSIEINGVAIGTYARNLVKEYTKQDDFLSNPEIFNAALIKAKELVDTSIKYL